MTYLSAARLEVTGHPVGRQHGEWRAGLFVSACVGLQGGRAAALVGALLLADGSDSPGYHVAAKNGASWRQKAIKGNRWRYCVEYSCR